MSRSVSGLAKLFLMALMLVGLWLANSRDTSLLIGLLLALASAAGLIILARSENALPLEHSERTAWEVIRAKGKRPFMLRSVRYGFFMGLIFILYQSLRSHRTGGTFTASYDFVLMALFLILYIGGSYYAAIRKWALYEEKYKESLPHATQHN